MTVPPGFFSQQPIWACWCFPLSDSSSFISSLAFFPGNAPANHQGPEGHLPPPATLASQDAPQMDPTLRIHWTHPSCTAPLPTERSSSNTWGSLLFKETFMFYLHWIHVLAGHRQTQVLASFLQLIACQMDKAPSRRACCCFSLTLFFPF